jgi:hypothetical protein
MLQVVPPVAHVQPPPSEPPDYDLSSSLVFAELMERIREIDVRRRSTERKMTELREDFNRCAPRARLCLRPWTQKKGESPYALYWIVLSRRREFYPTGRPGEARRPRWYRRLKIGTQRDLDAAIHRNGMDRQREMVHRFDARAVALNEQHRLLARGLDSVRKILASRATGREFGPTDMPANLLAFGSTPKVRRLLADLWEFECALTRIMQMAYACSASQRGQPKWVRFRLLFLRDREHPYGRLLWRDEETGQKYSSLDDRTKRRLRLYRDVRKAITPFEKERRELSRILKTRTSVVRRLKALTARILDVARRADVRPIPALPIGGSRERDSFSQDGVAVDRGRPGAVPEDLPERRLQAGGAEAGSAHPAQPEGAL